VAGPRRGATPPSSIGLHPALLADAVRALGGTLDLGRLTGRLTDLALEHLGADAAGVWLLERRNTELILYGDVGLRDPQAVTHVPYAAGDEILGWLVDRPAPFVLDDLPATAGLPARAWLEAEEIRSKRARRVHRPSRRPLTTPASPDGAVAQPRGGPPR
jgi:hypothetical protein